MNTFHKQDSIKRKQSFLRKEIIDSAFNQDEFVDFIESEKNGGSDINNWNLEELT